MRKKIEEVAKKIFATLGDATQDEKRAELPDQLAEDLDNLAQYIDHTILKPEVQKAAIAKICSEAEENRFASVCVNSVWASVAKGFLPSVPLCCVVGFPLGASTTKAKLTETKGALEAGANEVDMVINVGDLKDKEYAKVQGEIAALAAACHEFGAKLKVIIETCLLSEQEKIAACLLAKRARADFVKTSTGFSSAGATTADVALMREVVGSKMGVKASGGIRDKQTALAMLRAGANRIGASAGIVICG